jgi:diguanylate cyclase (GGDEF)-like protein/PAS domain S-box-containing protein
MSSKSGEQQYVSLSTKITVIVFWGLIFVGLIFAAILFRNIEVATQESRESLADNIAYRIHEALDHDKLRDNLELSTLMYLLEEDYPALSINLIHDGKSIAVAGENLDKQSSQEVLKAIRFTSTTGERVFAQVVIQFPSLQTTLHSKRTPLLIGLGILLLLFGSIVKSLLDRILSSPLSKMVETAREISSGNIEGEHSFDDKRDDEFGYVARFINEAIQKMQDSQDDAWDAKELAEVTLQSIGDGVITTDKEGKIRFMNPVAENMLGVSSIDVQRAYLRDIMLIIDEETAETIIHPITQCLYENRSIELESNCAIQRSDDKEYPVEITVSPIAGKGGEVHGAVIVLHDVRQARALQRELSYQASHDPLTGLYNRREFDRELKRALERTKRDNEEHALCYLDLDQFKIINDTCGHAAGDQLLQRLTATLRGKLRKADILARLGGDEFGVLLAHCPIERAIDVAESLRVLIKEFRFAWGDKSFQIGVSVGLVAVSQEQSCSAEILSAADMACYVAKEQGRNRVHIYQPDDENMHLRREEMGMVSAVRKALAEDRFELFAQPIISTHGESAPHYELLIRMRDEEYGYVSPGAFLPAAERYQLMSDIDRWVIGESLRLLMEQDRCGREVLISINLSGQSLGEEHFLDYVLTKLDRIGACATQVCFEITETVAVNNLSIALKFIEAIKHYGCKFSLDDFGAGVSSFGYLKNLPVDYVKIDGVFIRAIHNNEVDQAMVKAIAEVSRVMGIKTVAEFVENKESFDLLKEIGIDFAQGYWIEKPKPVSECLGAGETSNECLLSVVTNN